MKQLDLFRDSGYRKNGYVTFNRNGRCYGEILGAKILRGTETWFVKCACNSRTNLQRRHIISWHHTLEEASSAHKSRFTS
jgi:hypothetical protein